jgi:hypothetical protein
MGDVLIWIWLGGWPAITAAAAIIGGTEDGPDGDPPMFFWPMLFGWFWPAAAALLIVIGFFSLLAHLSDKYLKRADHAR